MSDLVKPISAPERTFERGRGCWNCKSFENDQLSRQRWRECRTRDLGHITSSGSLTRLSELELPIPSGKDARLDQIRFMDGAVMSGNVGLCLKGARPKDLGGPEGDFVHCKYLCDRWDGKTGHSVATAGRPLDKLNDELWDIAEGRAKPK